MRLPTIIGHAHFAPAELAALRLDGECFPLGDGLIAADEPVDPSIRARSLALENEGRGLVVERWTAAWIHGTTGHLPRPHQCSLDVRQTERIRTATVLREVRFLPEDVMPIGHVTVTTPFRTACDLARLEETFDKETIDTVLRLLDLADLTRPEAIELLRAAPRSPHKRRAVERLRRLELQTAPDAGAFPLAS